MSGWVNAVCEWYRICKYNFVLQKKSFVVFLLIQTQGCSGGKWGPPRSLCSVSFILACLSWILSLVCPQTSYAGHRGEYLSFHTRETPSLAWLTTVFLGKISETKLSIYYKSPIFNAFFKDSEPKFTVLIQEPSIVIQRTNYCPALNQIYRKVQWVSQANVHSKVSGKPRDIGRKMEKVFILRKVTCSLFDLCLFSLYSLRTHSLSDVFIALESLVYKPTSLTSWNSWS